MLQALLRWERRWWADAHRKRRHKMAVIDPNKPAKPDDLDSGPGSDRPQFKPTSFLTAVFNSIRFPTDEAGNLKPHMRDDGTYAFPVNLVLECVSDADGANKEGAKHEDVFWFDCEDAVGTFDTERGYNGVRLGILRRYAFSFFGGKGKNNPGRYPQEGDDFLLPWVALFKHGADATNEVDLTVVADGDYIKLKPVK
jgi:hypothetical protein